ncbi:hypothetical protein [Acidibrevibacterium fodinaquatile]|uniref:hypothetical protein n=1 Tax=Acidibrevibacterium fodinaquatile TaxID=1969806 RepID=UPI0013B39B02|nr:hypothetical protein [Acidibrevibacterium fodinaquatile]
MNKKHALHVLILASTGVVGLLLYGGDIVEGEGIFGNYDTENANEGPNAFGKKDGLKLNAAQGENGGSFSILEDKTSIVKLDDGIVIDIGDGGGDIISNIEGVKKDLIGYNDNVYGTTFNSVISYINTTNNSSEQNNNGGAIQNYGGNLSGGMLSGLSTGGLETTMSAMHNLDNLTKNPTGALISIGSLENSGIPKNIGTTTNTWTPANAETAVDEPSSLSIFGGLTAFFGLGRFLVKRRVAYMNH